MNSHSPADANYLRTEDLVAAVSGGGLTVYDNVTGLTWMASSDSDGDGVLESPEDKISWWDALDYPWYWAGTTHASESAMVAGRAAASGIFFARARTLSLCLPSRAWYLTTTKGGGPLNGNRRSRLASRRFAYFPMASVVVGIVILAAAVGAVSFRDINRGRSQIADVLERQGAAVARFLFADLHANLLGPGWQRGRLELFFEQAGSRREVAYVALLDENGKVLAHSDRELIGTQWPEDLMPDFGEPSPLVAPDFGPSGTHSAGRFVSYMGDRVYQFAGALDVTARELASVRPMRRGRGFSPQLRPDAPTVETRLSELLERPVAEDEDVRLVFVVAFESSQLEAAFFASRNHTLLMATILLIVGGAAIYFLFVLAGYRSAEIALSNMRSYTTNVIESMASGLVSVSPEGRVVTVNTMARNLLGLGSRDVSGRRLSEVLDVGPRSVADALARLVRGERDAVDAEAELSVGDERLPVSLSASSLMDEDGHASGTVILFQDLREVEELKAEVERARHLAAIGRLAAGVAHEVRNPLSSLKGFAQFFRGKFQPGSDEERYSDIMIEEVERLDRVVQELLDFAKPVEPVRKPVDPNAMVGEALALVSEDAGYRNVSIVRRMAGEPPRVLVDPFQIRQALLNILLNAIEAMGGGGTLTVETSVAPDPDAPADGPAGHVSISVSDTGPGLNVDELDKLFEPFYTTKQKGTGLGLTIVSRLVEQNGGHIGISSAVGEGTTFSVRLPVAAGDLDPASHTDSAAAADPRAQRNDVGGDE